MFRLRFALGKIDFRAGQYVLPDDKIEALVPAVRRRGFLTKREFLDICYWKTPRTQARCRKNAEEYIATITRTALATTDERLKIEILTLLEGVSWPTASVVLHFCDMKPYPILDFRALWSLGVSAPSKYTFALWEPYTSFVRELAATSKRSMRTIDRALWAYSKERQEMSAAGISLR